MGNRYTNARKTHCDKGHEFTEENTHRFGPDGRHRACKTCKRETGRKSMRASRARARAARKAPVVIMGLTASIWARLEIRDCGYETPCLVWAGTIASHGYGVVTIKRRQHLVHRLIHEAVAGPLPKRASGKVSDHLCRNRACANPTHIDLVANGVNVMRGVSFSPANAAKTHCDRGHEFTPENTITNKKGHRTCRECKRLTERGRYAARRARRKAAA